MNNFEIKIIPFITQFHLEIHALARRKDYLGCVAYMANYCTAQLRSKFMSRCNDARKRINSSFLKREVGEKLARSLTRPTRPVPPGPGMQSCMVN